LFRVANEIDDDLVIAEVDADVGAVEEVRVVEEAEVSSVGVVAAVTTCCSWEGRGNEEGGFGRKYESPFKA
jgi:hypothetical protein